MAVLSDSRLYYKTLRDAILSLLRDNKSTLNEYLQLGYFNNVYRQIRPGHPEVVPIEAELFPTILIKLANKQEEFLQLGDAGRKKPYINFILYGMVKNPKLNLEADNEIMHLSMNIASILRDNININSNCLWSDLGQEDFGVSEMFENGGYLDIVAIDLMCRVEIK